MHSLGNSCLMVSRSADRGPQRMIPGKECINGRWADSIALRAQARVPEQAGRDHRLPTADKERSEANRRYHVEGGLHTC